MRKVSFTVIILLCIAILVVDTIAFLWLKSITQFIDSEFLKNGIYITFWFFTFGLITAIIILKSRLAKMHPYRKQLLISSLYGLSISSFIPKLIFIIVISGLYFSHYLFSKNESLVIVTIVGLLSGFLPFLVILMSSGKCSKDM